MSTLAELLQKRRDPIIRRWLDKVRASLPSEQKLDEQEILDSLHHFLDEVIAALEGRSALPAAGQAIAQSHGAQRQLLRRNISEVVLEYGLLFAAVTEECPEPLPPHEYARLAAALNRGASEAVREYASLMALDLRREAWEHFAFLAHEIRGPLQTAQFASALVRSGAHPEKGMQTLDRSLKQLAESIEAALIDARIRGIDAGASLRLEEIEVDALLRQALDDVAPEAETRRIATRLEAHGDKVVGDRRVLLSALSNLIRNAIKFTRSGGEIVVRADHRRIEIEDECGGLRDDHSDAIFESFRQASQNRTGFGLGLAIAKEAIEAHHGTISVRNIPGKGCVFSVELPGAVT